MPIDATTLNDIVLAEHLVGSRLYDQLITPKSDYDWMRIIAGPRIVVGGVPAAQVIRALQTGLCEYSHTNLIVPDNFFRIQHPLWIELKANRKSFLTAETLIRLRDSFLVQMQALKTGSVNFKRAAELLRRGWNLLELLETQTINFSFSEEKLSLLQELRLSSGIPEAYVPPVDTTAIADKLNQAVIDLEAALQVATLNASTETFNAEDWLQRVESLTV